MSTVSVKGVVGSKIDLPCDVEQPDSHYSLEWRRADAKIYTRHSNKSRGSALPGIRDRIEESSRNFTLQLSNLRSSDQAVYRCVVLLLNKSSHPVAGTPVSLIIHSPPEFVDQPPAQLFLHEGENAFLRCAGKGNPEPSVAWVKNGVPVVLSSRIDLSSSGLRILRVEQSDQGLYRCILRNEISATYAESRLTFAEVPTLHNLGNRTALEGTIVRWSCRVKPLRTQRWGEVEIKWFFGDRELAFANGLGLRTTTEDNGTTLIIDPVERSDASQPFKCMAQNIHGIDSTAGYLTVQYPPSIAPSFHSAQILPLHRPAHLSCPFNANPPVHAVSWRKNGSRLAVDVSDKTAFRHFSDAGQRLHIENVTESDEGLYSCQGMSTVGYSPSHDIVVRVRHPPKITVFPNNQRVLLNRSASQPRSFDCAAEADDGQTITVTWERSDGRSLLPEQVTTSSSRAVLTLHPPFASADSGAYDCVVQSEDGVTIRKSLIVYAEGRRGPVTRYQQNF